MLAGFLTRLRGLLNRKTTDAELDEEMRYHLEREIDRNVTKGMSPETARETARRAFGNVTIATEQARDASRWAGVEALRQDVAYALRSFRRAPTFVITVVATIGLGIGLLSSAFTFFNAYVLRPLAVRDPASLYEVTWSAANGESHRFSLEQYERLRSTRGLVAETFAYSMIQARVRGAPTIGQFVSGNYFQMLGVPPALGRTMVPGDDDQGASRDVIVLSHHLWLTVFGADSSVVGQRVNLNGTALTVVGVARDGFGGLTSSPYDFWVPLSAAADVQSVPSRFRSLANNGLSVIVRLSPGVSAQQTRSMFTAWMTADTQGSAERERARGVTFTPRGTSMPNDPEVFAMFGPVMVAFLMVMLIACANVANLMLARGMARQREIGIRLTLGAARGRLIRQLLTEALVLALPAALLGFVTSRVAIAVSLSALFATVPAAYAGYIRVIPLDADLRIIVFMMGAAIVAAVAFGLAPAVQSTRPNVVRASRGDFESLRPSRLRGALVLAQITLSVVLLVTTGVLLASARRTERLDPGIRTRDVVQVEMLPRFRARGLDALRGDPIVNGMASSSATALDGAFSRLNVEASGAPSQRVLYNVVSPRWFDVLDLPIERGRGFTEQEGRDRATVAIVSRSAAAALWPGHDPIGETLVIPENDRSAERLAAYRTARVVGVVRDVSPGSIAIDPRMPVVYYPQPLDAGVTQFLVRVAGAPEQARKEIEQRLITTVDSAAAIESHTLETSLALQVYPFRAFAWVAAAIGVIALLLTLIGVYGVMSYLVAQRRKEFGIRLALGAEKAGLVALVLRQSMRAAALGAAIGVVIALAVSMLFNAILYNVDVFNAAGYVGGVLVVAVTCLAAAYVPSRRAAAVNPVETLRAE